MVLDRHRAAVDWFIIPFSRAMRNVDPNTITWISFPFAIAAGILYWQSSPANAYFLLLALAAVGIASILDLMDGKIAQLYNKQTKKGDYLDHVIDRFSDVVIFTGVAFSVWTDLRVGFFALIGILLTSYMGTQAQAVGIGRNYGGILGRADRLVILLFVSLFDYVRIVIGWDFPTTWFIHSGLDAMLWWYAIAGIFTAVQRFAQGLRWFDKGSG
jgi:archaetidylinositol phosphate synthase